MGFAVMTMTQAAASRVKAITENSGPDAKGASASKRAVAPVWNTPSTS